MITRLRSVADAWNGFWFTPGPAAPLALLRIAFGLVTICWTLSLVAGPGLPAFFDTGGILPHVDYGAAPGLWSVLRIWDSSTATVVVWCALLVGAILLTLGLFSRAMALVVLVAMLSLQRRNPFVFNSGDGLLRLLAFYLVLAPSGAYLSLDRLRGARDRFWEVPRASTFAIRLMQVQLSFLYLGSVWAKLAGPAWNDGTAITYALRVGDLHRFALPGVLSSSQLIANLATYGTLAVESALAILVWNRRLRPWVLGAGVVLHLSIAYGIRVGFFSSGVLVLYLAFLSPTAAERVIAAATGRFRPASSAGSTGSPDPVPS